MTIPQYHLIEDFIDPDYAKSLHDYFINNMQEDPRDNYGFYALGGYGELFVDNKLDLEFDPLNKIYEAVHFAYKFFLENYPMTGEFELNRLHGNYMMKGSSLSPHKDDVDLYPTIDDLPSKTHVCGLFLNDDYEGGETVFQANGVETKLKPKPGSLLFFPGYNIRHGVNEVLSGTRLNILIHFFDVVDRDNINQAYPAYK